MKYDPEVLEAIGECLPYWRKINDLILWIPEEDLDSHTLALRNAIQKHPLFMRNDDHPKTTIINVLIKYVPEDDNLTGVQIQKVIDILNKYSGIYGLRKAIARMITDKSLHLELRTLLDTILTKYRTDLYGKRVPVTRENLKRVLSD